MEGSLDDVKVSYAVFCSSLILYLLCFFLFDYASSFYTTTNLSADLYLAFSEALPRNLLY